MWQCTKRTDGARAQRRHIPVSSNESGGSVVKNAIAKCATLLDRLMASRCWRTVMTRLSPRALFGSFMRIFRLTSSRRSPRSTTDGASSDTRFSPILAPSRRAAFHGDSRLVQPGEPAVTPSCPTATEPCRRLPHRTLPGSIRMRIDAGEAARAPPQGYVTRADPTWRRRVHRRVPSRVETTCMSTNRADPSTVGGQAQGRTESIYTEWPPAGSESGNRRPSTAALRQPSHIFERRTFLCFVGTQALNCHSRHGEAGVDSVHRDDRGDRTAALLRNSG